MIKPFKPYYPEQPWLPFSEVLCDWDEDFHQLMLCDHIRMQAYETAIKASVKPGDTVVDLGTGTGILAQWALEAGAQRVYGIDMDAHILALAKTRIQQRGFADRFVAINDLSYNVKLPQQADVLISEIIGNIGDNEDFQPILQDGLARFLKPRGCAIPSAVQTFLVPVAALKAHQSLHRGDVFTLNDRYQLHDLMQQKNIQSPFNLYYDTIIPTARHLSIPHCVQDFCGRLDQPPQYQKTLRFTVQQPWVLTGFKGYFRATLSADVVLDISSGDIENRLSSDSWKHSFFPIEQPVNVIKGDEVILTFERRYPLAADTRFRQQYFWHGSVVRNGHTLARFAQGMGEAVDFPPAQD